MQVHDRHGVTKCAVMFQIATAPGNGGFSVVWVFCLYPVEVMLGLDMSGD